jgi:hypothetical protein
MKEMTIKIAPRDIPDFYYMLRCFAHSRGNTFAYLKKEIEKMYPELMKDYAAD